MKKIIPIDIFFQKSILILLFLVLILFTAQNIHGQNQIEKSSNEKNYTTKLPLIRDLKFDKYGFIDQSGKIIIPHIYDGAGTFSEGLAIVIIKNKYGYIDNTGKIIIPWLKYYDAMPFSNGLAVVREWDERTGFKCGYINKKGRNVIPVIYDNAMDFKEGIAIVTKGEERFFIDTTGNIVFKLTPGIHYTECHEGLIRFLENHKYGFLDKKGNVVLPAKYYSAGVFTNGIVEVKDSLCWGVINKKGDTIVPFLFDYIDIQSKNLIVVRLHDKSGFLDKRGKIVLPLFFDHAWGNSNEYGFAGINGESFNIYSHNDIIKAKFKPSETNKGNLPEEANPANLHDQQDGYFIPPYQLYSEELAPVVKNGLVGFINKEKNLVIPFQYKFAQSFSGGLAAVSDGKKWGFTDKNNKIVIPLIYDKVLRFQANITGVWIASKYYTIKKNGELYQ